MPASRARDHQRRSSLLQRSVPPPSLFRLPVSGSAGVSAELGRIFGGCPRATARPPASSGSSGSGSLLGSGWPWCCGLLACPPRRSARSLRMSWMRKEVSRLDCEGGAAQGLRPPDSTRASRDSNVLSILTLLCVALLYAGRAHL